MSFAGYALMRRVGLAPLHAGAIAALVLLFPWSDSTRLWAMASFNQIAVILWALGVLIALRGLRERGRRAVALHAAALVMYVLATLMYELAGGLVVISALFYLFRGTWRQAAVRWLPDLAVAYLALDYVKQNTLPRPVLPFSQALDHASTIVGQSFTLLARTAFPFGVPARNVVVGLIAIALAAGLVAWLRAPATDPLRADLRRWLIVAAAGAVVVLAGYLTIAPAYYGAPLDAGIENRVNMIAAFGYVAIAYSAAAVAGLLVVRRAGRPPRLAVALPLALSLLMALGFLAKLGTDKRAYDAAYAQGQRTLGGIARAYGQAGPPHGSTTYAFGFASFQAPGIPVFAWVWDMPGAMKVSFQDPSLGAFPILPGTTWQCNAKSMYPVSPYGTGPGETGQYGNSWFVDATAGVAQRIDSKAECESAQQRFQPGPVKAGSDCVLSGGGPATRLPWLCGHRPST
jgi:hypothetical protein